MGRDRDRVGGWWADGGERSEGFNINMDQSRVWDAYNGNFTTCSTRNPNDRKDKQRKQKSAKMEKNGSNKKQG